MNAAVVLGLAWLVLVAVAGIGLTWSAPALRLPAWTDDPRRRGRSVVAASAQVIGRPLTALFIAAAGLMLLIFVMWALGVVAHHTQDHVDWPVFRYFQHRQVGGGWQRAWKVLTQMGNGRKTGAGTILAAVVFTVIWRVRRRPSWWAPLFGLPLAFAMEKYGQFILKRVVDRGHPPTGLGTYVSGGCARLIVAYGMVMLLTLRVTGASRRWWVAGFSLVGFLAAVEAYSRVYLLKHWVTDVAGGLLYGAGVLVIAAVAFSVLDGP
jgi:hypothetical protein